MHALTASTLWGTCGVRRSRMESLIQAQNEEVKGQKTELVLFEGEAACGAARRCWPTP